MAWGKGQELYIHKIMDILIQNPWSLFPTFLILRIFDRHFWDQWDSDFFGPFNSLLYYQRYFWRHASWWDPGRSEASKSGVNNLTCSMKGVLYSQMYLK